MTIPAERAFGGSAARKSRVAREVAEKGLNFVFTSVMNLVIMFSAGRERGDCGGLDPWTLADETCG